MTNGEADAGGLVAEQVSQGTIDDARPRRAGAGTGGDGNKLHAGRERVTERGDRVGWPAIGDDDGIDEFTAGRQKTHAPALGHGEIRQGFAQGQRERPAIEDGAAIFREVIDDVERPDAVGIGVGEGRQPVSPRLLRSRGGHGFRGYDAVVGGPVGTGDDGGIVIRQRVRRVVVQNDRDVEERVVADAIRHEHHVRSRRSDEQDVEVIGEIMIQAVEGDGDFAHDRGQSGDIDRGGVNGGRPARDFFQGERGRIAERDDGLGVQAGNTHQQQQEPPDKPAR